MPLGFLSHWALTASMLFLPPLIAVQQQQPEQQLPEGWGSLLRRSLQAHELPDPSSLPSIVVRPQDWLNFVKYCPLCSSKCHMCAHCYEGKLKTHSHPLHSGSSSVFAVAPYLPQTALVVGRSAQESGLGLFQHRAMLVRVQAASRPEDKIQISAATARA
jgi:hypothetical protein